MSATPEQPSVTERVRVTLRLAVQSRPPLTITLPVGATASWVEETALDQALVLLRASRDCRW